MGYFSNGSEGMSYEARWCDRCVHQEGGCAVWGAHLFAKSGEMLKPDSVLHELIPRSANGLTNDQCLMFWAKAEGR